jgi:glutaredoxin
MTQSLPSPILTLYRREGCHLCDEARVMLQQALEERVLRGELTARVREVDIDADPDLRARYTERVPVLAIDGMQLDLVTSIRQVRAFLDRALPRLA